MIKYYLLACNGILKYIIKGDCNEYKITKQNQ